MSGELKEFAHQLRLLCPSDVDDYDAIHFSICVIATDMEAIAAHPTPAHGALPELLRQVYGMAREGCDSPSAAYRWCERIDELFHAGKPSEEYADYAQDLPDATRAYAEQCRAGVWMPIESAPKDGSSILVTGGEWFSDDGNYVFRLDIVVIATWMYDKWFIGAGYAHDVNHWAEPTHWMPLPAPPALQSAFADDEGVK